MLKQRGPATLDKGYRNYNTFEEFCEKSIFFVLPHPLLLPEYNFRYCQRYGFAVIGVGNPFGCIIEDNSGGFEFWRKEKIGGDFGEAFFYREFFDQVIQRKLNGVMEKLTAVLLDMFF